MADYTKEIEQAKDAFGQLLEQQLNRVDNLKEEGDFVNFDDKDEIVIGIVGGDGIGPYITREAEDILKFLLKEDIEKGRIKFKEIDGLTIENRAKHNKAIPDDV